ncbi:MAG: peptidase M14 [Candidatus Eremiobacteraeota bacterium]|nr:peptidase M14 [Candidatus Eremiobacteraeota bacterium]MCW5867050.1 peptidase M14 [Candidatus Eremiobacteraeota bacterium]
MKILLACLAGLSLLAAPAPATPENLRTQAEESGFQRTGRYEEVPRMCQAFVERWPQYCATSTFGTTPEGRPMQVLVASQTGALTPEQAHAAGIPVLLFQGGIHAGEIDGKDAGFLALRQLLESDGLRQVVVVFVPVFNVDGHERFGRYHRPNQVGPEEMGWRVTSQNLNLNRDYTKAEAPEMQAMLALLNNWDPILYVDLHVTDGAEFQPEIANLIEPIFVGDPHLQPLGKALQKDVNRRLSEQGCMALDFYPSLRNPQDPASGFSDGAYTPRFSTGYWALHNRLSMLVETHSWKDYARRVELTRKTILALVELANRDGVSWVQAGAAADRAARLLGGQTIALSHKNTEHHRDIYFPGYAYKKTASQVSGDPAALSYDANTPKIWKIPFYDEVVPDQVSEAPRGGYLVPAGQAPLVAAKLKLHNLQYRVLEAGLSERPLEVFRADSADFSQRSFEGRQMLRVKGQWRSEKQALAPGSLWVPTAQPNSRLLLALLEPMAPDSLLSWGFFNAHFEQKEYMEEYVAEAVGKEMLARRPEIAAEFLQKLASDPEFAKSPAARLDFFYRHHPSYDQRFNLYPIMRSAEVLP